MSQDQTGKLKGNLKKLMQERKRKKKPDSAAIQKHQQIIETREAVQEQTAH